jgi:hypothetical protein
MAAFQRSEQRFLCNGVCVNAPLDKTPPGKYPILQNVRSYVAGTIQARLGITAIANGVLAAGTIHSIGRLNDPTGFATAPFFRFFGAGVAVRAGQAAYPQIDTGYSGNPLTFTVAAPVQSPQPWMYVTDTSRMRKINTSGTIYPIGVAAPVNPPSLALDPLYRAIISTFTGTPWVAAGTAASAPVAVSRVNTTISAIFYDSGATGNCSVVPVSMDGIDTGTLISFNAGETEPVEFVTIAIADTTIAQIIYDVGATGLCTIQPTASLGTGQLEAPTVADYAARAGGYATPRTAGPASADISRLGIGRIRQIDFPVNCLVRIAAAETVRILSVAIGPDGIQSFRCSTTGTRAAGDALSGIAAFRCSTTGTFAAANTLTAAALQNTITPSGAPSAANAGIKTGVGWVFTENPAFINVTATQPDDDVHLAIRISDCTVVNTVRVYFDVDRTTNDFTQNTFFFEWRANDIIAAIQAANVAPVASLQSTRSTTIANEALNQGGSHVRNREGDFGSATPWTGPNTTGTPLAIDAVTSALAIGNNQWIELHCKVRDLVRVGTDPSRTLGNIAAAEVLVNMTGASPITVSYHSVWISGGRGPDVGVSGPPYVTCYRYRSSVTGAISNPSPATRGGVVCRRQGMTSTGALSADTQVDLVDWFRFGGALTEWTYAGTTPNTGTPSFDDTFSDSNIVGGPKLEYTRAQPFSVPDLPRVGTCKVAGNAVQRLSGANFNVNWAPGTPIVINGRVYSLYAQPTSTTLLFLNENAGAQASTAFTVTEPTLVSQNLPAFWGDVGGLYFACGDPNNPGALYWTYPYDPDRHADTNINFITSGAEVLQHGFVYDGVPFVFSTEQLYTIQVDVTAGIAQAVRAYVTPCGKGLWTRWAWCWTPYGIVFLAKDGIYLTTGGPAESLTDADLYPLFPHDGVSAVTVNGYNPPDMTSTTNLRLSYVNGWVYFDYLDTGAARRTLAFRFADRSWWPDVSTPGIQSRFSAPGNAIYEELIGGVDGTVYSPAGFNDNAVNAIACRALVVDDQGDFRREKLYRDFMLDGVFGTAAVTATVGYNSNVSTLTPVSLGGTAARAQYPSGIIPTTGLFAHNLVLDCTWNPTAVGVPQLFGWDIAFQPAPELSPSWLSGPTTHGLNGYQQVAGIYLAYRANGPCNLSLIIDGVLYNYVLPSTGSQYAKFFQWLRAVKGLTFQYGVQGTSGASLQVFDADVEVMVQDWGKPGYKIVRPF